MELDRGKLISWQHNYLAFLRHRDTQLASEEKANTEFDKKLAKEEDWIRQGIKARRTRNEGRVRALQKMREEVKARRSRRAVRASPSTKANCQARSWRKPKILPMAMMATRWSTVSP